MAQNVYLGLAVSNRTTSALATATFDSVSVTRLYPIAEFFHLGLAERLDDCAGSRWRSYHHGVPAERFQWQRQLVGIRSASGVTASFNPSSAASTSTLTLTASSTAIVGTVTVTVTGISGSLSHSTTLSLTVTPPPNYTLSASPKQFDDHAGNHRHEHHHGHSTERF